MSKSNCKYALITNVNTHGGIIVGSCEECTTIVAYSDSIEKLRQYATKECEVSDCGMHIHWNDLNECDALVTEQGVAISTAQLVDNTTDGDDDDCSILYAIISDPYVPLFL